MFSNKFVSATVEMCDYDHHVPAPLFRRKFSIGSLPENALFTICGLGFYELYINGRRITKGQLAPYVSNPDDLLYYDEYNVTEFLKEGDNVIGIILGNGFFNCFGGSVWDFDKAAWRGPLRVAFSLELDGELLFEADENVKVSDSAITFDDLRIGVFYDAGLEKAGWNTPDYDDALWANADFVAPPKGKPRLCEAEPVTVHEERKPVSIKHFDDFYYCCENNVKYEDFIERTRVKDTWLYDFGVNDTGICRLKIKGKKGQVVKLRFAEMLVDGYFSIRTTVFKRDDKPFLIDYPQMDIYTLKGEGEEIFVPPFTYHGFRYVLVEGITEEQATEDLLTCFTVSSDFPERGNFSCSDDVLNKLAEMTIRSDRSNFVFFPTDCPHREKNGWTADAALSSEHMLLHMSATKSLREWMRNICKAQREDGALPGIIPTAGWGFEWGNGPSWDQVCVIIPFYCYKYDGDIEIIKESKELILRYARYIYGKRNDLGLVEIGLVDWCQPYSYGKPLSPLRVTDSMAVYDIFKKAAFLFGVIGDKESQIDMEKKAKEMLASIRENLIDWETFTVEGECQTSQALGIAFDIFTQDEKKHAVDRLIEIIHKNKDSILCGFLGGRHIFHILSQYGHTELALKMIMQPDLPSYAGWIEEGNTTLCENFHVKDEKRDSLNHHCWGDIYSFFVKRLAGLKVNPHNRDICEFEISPTFTNSLNFANAYYDSQIGRVSVHWERKEDNITLEVNVPEKVYGQIVLPDNFRFSDGNRECALKSGKWELFPI